MRLRMLLCEASPEEIRRESCGIVDQPDLLDWRTLQPAPGGLFDEQIFGLVRGGICRCYHPERIRFTGPLCATCGVEISLARLQQERMARIELNAPVCHIAHVLGSPGRLALLLGLSQPALENVIYLRRVMVTAIERERLQAHLPEIEAIVQAEIRRLSASESPGAPAGDEAASKTDDLLQASDLQRALTALPSLRKRQVLLPSVYRGLRPLLELLAERRPEWGTLVSLATGADAIRTCLQETDLVRLAHELRHQIEHFLGKRGGQAAQRLEAVNFYRQESHSLSWIVLECLPVLSPALRPLILQADGKAIVYDLNDLYRRAINRNNRMKGMIEIGAPESVCNLQQKLLQESVDNLIFNTRSPKPLLNAQDLPYRSLFDLFQALATPRRERA